MAMDSLSAINSYSAIAQVGRENTRTREAREELRLAAGQRNSESTQVTLSREARQAELNEQVQKRERVNGNDRAAAPREGEGAAVAAQQSDGQASRAAQQTAAARPNASEAITAYRDTSRI